ncbi:hypothetical protein BK784_28495 [Bacillus thuringiensis serovar medellin]|uniref:AAA domain-containing protein n=1 Tax=Bacillus thuringiensis subsp. medellin TaxID=79672 RepID=A0A9X6RB65_BACTV|nr:AAA family ATPase [Bacillus thuringiensis]OUB88459.1 hypothetical protein BK784_28495 [Bacillus thuringiensis serovar medellin]
MTTIKTLAFWSNHINEGKRTISQSVATTLAENGYKVLYVELDYMHPSLAISTGLTHPKKNIFNLIESRENFSISDYIAKKSDVEVPNDELRKNVSKVPSNLSFLSFPITYEFDEFPVIEDQSFINTFLTAVQDCNYDVVIYNLPNNLDDLFTYQVMLEADKVFHIISPNLLRMRDYKKTKKVLETIGFDLNKWHTILNKSNLGVQVQAYENVLNEKIYFEIGIDHKRNNAELNMEIGSEAINSDVTRLIEKIGYTVEKQANLQEKKRWSFMK